MTTLDEFAEAQKPPSIDKLDDRALAEEAERRGWIIHRDDPAADRHIEIDAPRRGQARIAVVSDTHLCSKYQQLTHWRAFAAAAAEFKVDLAIHAGDAVDGTHHMHRGMEYEQFRHGAEAQANYAIENWPEIRRGRRAVTQHVIGGNHDGSFHSTDGANVLRTIADNRSDITFLGAPAATFHIGPLELYLLHPDGGPSYARSYKLQKIVEQLAPDSKPHILMAGHWHVANHLPGYRNVESFALPCFQSQTPYLRRKGLAPVVGGLLLDVTYSERGLEDMATRWMLFRSTVDKDWP